MTIADISGLQAALDLKANDADIRPLVRVTTMMTLTTNHQSQVKRPTPRHQRVGLYDWPQDWMMRTPAMLCRRYRSRPASMGNKTKLKAWMARTLRKVKLPLWTLKESLWPVRRRVPVVVQALLTLYTFNALGLPQNDGTNALDD